MTADVHHLSAVDTAWFRLDDAVNTADIVGLIVFEDPLDIDRFRDVVSAKFATFPQFRQRIVDSAAAALPHWENVPDFDIREQIQPARLENGTTEELHRFVGDVLTRTLPRDRPLWVMYAIENFGEGSALVVKIHHCLGDGFALVGVLLSLADESPSDTTNLGDGPATPGLRAQLWDGLADAVRHPSHAVDAAKTSGKLAGALGELLMLSFDTPTSLRRELSGHRVAAWSQPIDLERFRQLAHHTEGTVNDVLLTVLTGALRQWMSAAGDDVDEAEIRAMIPVNLRPLEEMGKELGNKFGLVFMDVPIGAALRSERLARVREAMTKLKQSPQAVVAIGILGALGLAPSVIEHLAGEIFTRKASLVVTNVPGPREKLRLADNQVDHMMFWVPHPALLGLGVSLFSYAGEVRIGVRSDIAVTSDPAALVRAFEAELEAMEAEFDY